MLYSVIPPANKRFIHVVLEALEQIVAVCKVPNVTSYRKYMRRGPGGKWRIVATGWQSWRWFKLFCAYSRHRGCFL